jgi:hypothetical protein
MSFDELQSFDEADEFFWNVAWLVPAAPERIL